MTRQETVAILESASNALDTLFWHTKDAQIRTAINMAHSALTTTLTQVDQDDIESRTADFTAAAKNFESEVLPKIKKVQEAIEKEVHIYLPVRTAMDDLEKANTALQFLMVPNLTSAVQVTL